MKNWGVTIFTICVFVFCILLVLYGRDSICRKYGMKYSVIAGQCGIGGIK